MATKQHACGRGPPAPPAWQGTLANAAGRVACERPTRVQRPLAEEEIAHVTTISARAVP